MILTVQKKNNLSEARWCAEAILAKQWNLFMFCAHQMYGLDTDVDGVLRQS